MRDYAVQYLNLLNSQPAWATEYAFTRAYALPRPNLAALEDLTRQIRQGNPDSGVGKLYANYFGAEGSIFLTRETWLAYSCAQTEMTASGFAQCKGAQAQPRP